MSELFLSYIPKVKGESVDFKIIDVIKTCMGYYPNGNNIISSPGYMSKTLKSINDFVDEFQKIVPPKKIIHIGYLKGLTGTVKRGSTKIIDEHYKKLSVTGKFKQIKIKVSNNSDHRKMIFFFGVNDNPTFNFSSDTLNKKNKKKFLNSISVNAILMGSSNQSYNTYYGGSAKKADKGEADVLMFIEDNLNYVNNNDMFVEGTVIFKAMRGMNSDPHEYLKEILNDFLNNALN